MERQCQPFPTFPQRSLGRDSTCYQFQMAALVSGTVRAPEAVAEGWGHKGSRVRAARPWEHCPWHTWHGMLGHRQQRQCGPQTLTPASLS